MPSTLHDDQDDAAFRALSHFREMVESVGVKRFAAALGVSTRQVNRILSGAQPNPLERVIRCMQSCAAEHGDRALDYLCQEMGGYFVRHEGTLDSAALNAVRESAEAIAAIADGEITEIDEVQIRQAVSALSALGRHVQAVRSKAPAVRFQPPRHDGSSG